MGKAKASSGKVSGGQMKKIHLRQHLRHVIKKCLKRPSCFMDIKAFESWKALGFGGINELGKFAKKVEVNSQNGQINIIEFYSAAEIEGLLSRIHVKGPVHTKRLKESKSEKTHHQKVNQKNAKYLKTAAKK